MLDGSVTGILHDLAEGVAVAEERLFERVYDELRIIARRLVARERKARAKIRVRCLTVPR